MLSWDAGNLHAEAHGLLNECRALVHIVHTTLHSHPSTLHVILEGDDDTELLQQPRDFVASGYRVVQGVQDVGLRLPMEKVGKPTLKLADDRRTEDASG